MAEINQHAEGLKSFKAALIGYDWKAETFVHLVSIFVFMHDDESTENSENVLCVKCIFGAFTTYFESSSERQPWTFKLERCDIQPYIHSTDIQQQSHHAVQSKAGQATHALDFEI